MATVAMPLDKALRILVEIHTRDDDLVGFHIVMGAKPDSYASPWSQREYAQAWHAVRAHIHLQTEPRK